MAFHFTVRGPQEMCVANLINHDKADKLSSSDLLPRPTPKARVGQLMRSGKAVREALQQHSASIPSSLPPSLDTSHLHLQGATQVEGGREEGREVGQHYVDMQGGKQHNIAAAAAATAAGGPEWHLSPFSPPGSSTPSSIATSPSSWSSSSGLCQPIDRTPFPPFTTSYQQQPQPQPQQQFRSSVPPPSSSCSSSMRADQEQEAAFLSQQVGGGGGRGGFDGSSGMSMAASAGS